eukprot:186602-Amphidinium_carterae.1
MTGTCLYFQDQSSHPLRQWPRSQRHIHAYFMLSLFSAGTAVTIGIIAPCWHSTSFSVANEILWQHSRSLSEIAPSGNADTCGVNNGLAEVLAVLQEERIHD